MKRVLQFSVLLLAIVCFFACGSDDEGNDRVDDFDRAEMLAHWVDKTIIPAYDNYVNELTTLRTEAEVFTNTPDASTLSNLRTAWLDAYLAWQPVSMFDIGKAESITIRNYTNIFPANTTEIDDNIAEGNFTLSLPSKNDEQGFPALDYLLYGIGNNAEEVVNKYTNDASAQNYKMYLTAVVERLLDLATEVRDDWKGDYRSAFVSNDGSSATSSVNKMVNDYLFYYEKFLRAGKIGIPAGVFSNQPLSQSTEALYSGQSKILFDRALNATQDFFNGKSFEGTTTGPSLSTYLEYLGDSVDGEDLVAMINQRFETSRTKAQALDTDFSKQVETNNILMLETYDALQSNVVLLKVDMLQALNVKVDFVDADGD